NVERAPCAYGGGAITDPVDGLRVPAGGLLIEPYGGDGDASDRITVDDGPPLPFLGASGPDVGGGTACIALIVGANGLDCTMPGGGSMCEPVPPSRITVGCAGSSVGPAASRVCVTPAASDDFGGDVLAMSASARICVDCSGSGVAPGAPLAKPGDTVVFSAPSSSSGASPDSSAASTRSASSAPSSTLVDPPNSPGMPALPLRTAAPPLLPPSTSLPILRCSSRICCSRFISSANCSRIHVERCLAVNIGSRVTRKACSASCISFAHWKRSSTSRANALLMIFSSSGGTFLLIDVTGGTSTLRTFSSVSKSLSPMNRRSEVSSSYRIVPIANTSERRSSGSPRTCSGLM